MIIDSNMLAKSSDKSLETTEKKQTRKEKKVENSFSTSRFSQKRDFSIPYEDLEVLRRRKPKKYSKTLLKQQRTFKKFYKGEAIINKWLVENFSRFNVKLIVNPTGGYNFEGVIENVKLSFCNYNAEAMIDFYHEGEQFDQLVISYIGDESFHPQKGFYDGDRTDGIYTYFPTREELYSNEVFEYLVKDCNRLFVPQNSLYILDFNGATMAFIGLTDESDISDKYVQKEVAQYPFIEDSSDEECKKLYDEDKAYRIIKYELFNVGEKPLIRYIKNLL